MSRIFSFKVMGAAAGLFSGGILGAIVGGVLGSMIDTIFNGSDADVSARKKIDYRKANPKVGEFIFVTNLVALLTSVAKADREIHPLEVQAIKNFFSQNFHYTGHDGNVIASLIREAAGRKLDLREIAADVRRMLEYPERLMIIRLLYTVALSDAVLKGVERERITDIAGYLNISETDHDFIKRELGIKPDDDLYAVLGISPDASNEEVKAAYHEMVKKYHPDRVAHLGKDFVRIAQEKFVTIQSAYQKISAERNL